MVTWGCLLTIYVKIALLYWVYSSIPITAEYVSTRRVTCLEISTPTIVILDIPPRASAGSVKHIASSFIQTSSLSLISPRNAENAQDGHYTTRIRRLVGYLILFQPKGAL